MLQKVFLFVFLLFCFSAVYAQKDTAKVKPVKKDTTYWKKGGFAVLTFNQVRLTNWKAGGEDALSATSVVNLFASYKKGNSIWDNSLDLGYGLMKNNSAKVRKNEDKIELNSKFGYKAFGKVYYSSQVNYRSQFDKGYNYPNDTTVVSRFNAPGYLTISLGIDYKPADYFSLFLSPITGRFTFVSAKSLSNQGAYGVDVGKRVQPAFGANLSAKFQKDVVKNVNIVSKLQLFNNYTDKDKANRKNIDVNWDMMINIKAGKYLTTSIFANVIYDQNVVARTQFKEVLGVGVSYKF